MRNEKKLECAKVVDWFLLKVCFDAFYDGLKLSGCIYWLLSQIWDCHFASIFKLQFCALNSGSLFLSSLLKMVHEHSGLPYLS